METKNCNSCKKAIGNEQGSTSFSCPKCDKQEILRCSNCRKNAARYTCAQCGFAGPN